jgi:hypothetical protein
MHVTWIKALTLVISAPNLVISTRYPITQNFMSHVVDNHSCSFHTTLHVVCLFPYVEKIIIFLLLITMNSAVIHRRFDRYFTLVRLT